MGCRGREESECGPAECGGRKKEEGGASDGKRREPSHCAESV